ncbi:hypothetical protein SISSUDRAFT_1056585 [Sistotremastrum suecicum HHB10207 ss-3]|uniref:Uncharacterized protein n=1 Tax=Sistotremastrum suecicum HHB10207 ss-3 TaxID=1314776 RepID=A0A165WJ42_9AGAM|nr:hypothetical protein SISSUDRAFT_1056585 [Sistotremastrum suecicum HHB10207 ss-3]
MARNEMIRDALECLSSSGDDAVNVYFVKLRPLLDAYPPGKRATAFLAVTTILVKWITALGQKRHHDASRLRADLIAMGLSSDPAHSIHFARPGYLGPVIAACYEENDIALGQDILKTTMLHAPDAQCWSYNLSLTFMSPLYRSLRTELEVPVTWEPLAWLWGYTIGRFVLVNIEKDEQTIAQGGKRRASDVVAEREALDANKRMVCDLYEIMPEEERARILGKDFARVNATMLSVMTPTPTPDSSLATDASLAGDLPGANAEDRALPHPTRPHSIHRPVPIPPLPLVPLATTSSVTARPSPHPQVSTRVEPPSAKVSVASRAVTRAPHPEGSSAATQRFDRPTKASSSKTGGKRKAEELEPPNDQEPTAGTSADAGPSEKRQKMTTRRTVNEGLMKRGTAYLSNAGGSSAGAVLSGSSRANIIS